MQLFTLGQAEVDNITIFLKNIEQNNNKLQNI